MLSTRLQNALAAEEQKLVACIHCGLCLEACPTYVVTADENDGPRGRIYLMRAVAENRLANSSESFRNHIDRCLGCRACEQVCPAGVEYGHLLEASRGELFTSQPQHDFASKVLRFALKHLWGSPTRLRLFFAATRLFRDLRLPDILVRTRLARLLSRRAEFSLRLLAGSRPNTSRVQTRAPSDLKQTKPRHGTVFLFGGCVGDGLFAHVNRATSRVLEVNGYNVELPNEQVCCGALHAHAGDLEGARALARRNIQAFGDEPTPIITNAGGCGAMLISYGQMFEQDEIAEAARRFSARVKDVSQQLASTDMKKSTGAEDRLVTYDASCHLLYVQHAADSSKEMLRSIGGLNFTELKGSERCCGAAGVYNLIQPEMSARVLEEKLKNIADSRAAVVTTGNPGCQMQIAAGACAAGMKLNVRHPVEILDESYERAGFYDQQKQ